MKTITIQVYSFSELSESVQDKVICKFSEINLHHTWYEHIFNEWKEKLTVLGYSNIELSFDGFYFQGAAAVIFGSLDIMKKSRVKDAMIKIGSVSFSRSRSFHLSSEVGYNFNDYEHEDLEDFVNTIEAKHRDLEWEFFTYLRMEYEYLTSRDVIIESIDANEYLFLENGDLAP